MQKCKYWVETGEILEHNSWKFPCRSWEIILKPLGLSLMILGPRNQNFWKGSLWNDQRNGSNYHYQWNARKSSLLLNEHILEEKNSKSTLWFILWVKLYYSFYFASFLVLDHWWFSKDSGYLHIRVEATTYWHFFSCILRSFVQLITLQPFFLFLLEEPPLVFCFLPNILLFCLPSVYFLGNMVKQMLSIFLILVKVIAHGWPIWPDALLS